MVSAYMLDRQEKSHFLISSKSGVPLFCSRDLHKSSQVGVWGDARFVAPVFVFILCFNGGFVSHIEGKWILKHSVTMDMHFSAFRSGKLRVISSSKARHLRCLSSEVPLCCSDQLHPESDPKRNDYSYTFISLTIKYFFVWSHVVKRGGLVAKKYSSPKLKMAAMKCTRPLKWQKERAKWIEQIWKYTSDKRSIVQQAHWSWSQVRVRSWMMCVPSATLWMWTPWKRLCMHNEVTWLEPYVTIVQRPLVSYVEGWFCFDALLICKKENKLFHTKWFTTFAHKCWDVVHSLCEHTKIMQKTCRLIALVLYDFGRGGIGRISPVRLYGPGSLLVCSFHFFRTQRLGLDKGKVMNDESVHTSSWSRPLATGMTFNCTSFVVLARGWALLTKGGGGTYCFDDSHTVQKWFL